MTTLRLVIATIVAVLTWMAVAGRLPPWSASHHAARVWLWGSLVSLATAATISHPALAQPLGDLAGRPTLVWVLRCGLLVIATWAMIAFLTHIRRPAVAATRRIRQGGLVAGAVIVLLTGLVGSAPTHSPTSATWEAFILTHGHEPVVAAGVAVYLVAIALALAEIIRTSLTYAATLGDRPAARTGMRLIAAAGLLGEGCMACLGWLLAAQHLPLTLLPAPLTVLLRLGAIGAVALGVTVPVVARVLGDYRAYQSLQLLVLMVFRQNTEPVAGRRRDRLVVRDLPWRIYRRIAVIRAGQLELRPWMAAQQASSARQHGHHTGLRDDDVDAYVEARLLLRASLNRSRHRPPASQPRPGELPGGSNQRTETAFLLKVTRNVAAVLTPRRRRALAAAALA